MNERQPPLKIAVAGGSIGGLCAGVALDAAGCNVEVFERTPGEMTSRGAGIVVQPEITALLERAGGPSLPTTGCTHRLYLEPDGGAGRLSVMPQRFTSWEAIYRSLRGTFPAQRYHTGAKVGAAVSTSNGVKIEINGTTDTKTLEVDLLVAADGVRSTTRRHLLPDTSAHYAGYVAYRGTLAENEAPAELVHFFEERFAFCQARSGGHILHYLIPGDAAATTPGQRRMNWVWYVPVTEGEALTAALTDRAGRIQDLAVSPGMLADSAVSALQRRANDELHARFAELVRMTPEPFIQSIVDIRVPQMVFGRTCLTGDAAFVVRPHTAAASAKAAADATALADAITQAANLEAALAQWQTSQLEMGQRLTDYGVALGRRTGTTS